MSVTVKWGRERLSFAIPSRDTALSSIRQSLRDYTGISSFKLIHKGAVLNDDSASLQQYHIGPGSVLILLPTPSPSDIATPVVSDRDQAHVPQTDAAPGPGVSSEENAVLTTINTELANVRSTLAPELNDLLAHSNNNNRPNSAEDKKDYLRLGELLLQSLLRLDGIAPERDWHTARKARKEAVKEVQALLDCLDDTVAARKAAGLH